MLARNQCSHAKIIFWILCYKDNFFFTNEKVFRKKLISTSLVEALILIRPKKKGDYFNSTQKIVLFYANIKLQCKVGILIMIKETMTSVFKQR